MIEFARLIDPCAMDRRESKNLMHYEDALKFVIARLTVDPKVFVGDNRAEADVWIPRAVQLFLAQENPDNPNFYRLEYCQYGAPASSLWISDV